MGKWMEHILWSNSLRPAAELAIIPILAAALAIVPVARLKAAEESLSSASGERKRISVAVFPFENGTSDPNLAHWRYIAWGLLKNQLAEVKAVRVLSEGAIDYALRQVDLTAGEAIDPNLARDMGEHIEAQRAVWGRYTREENRWRVAARVLNVATGEVSGPFVALGADWFDLRDTLNEQIIRQLGVTPTEEQREKMAKRWTSSPAALEWYGKAYASQEQGRHISEQETCSRNALSADPNCFPALVGLAAVLGNQGKFAVAEDLARRALQIDSEYGQAHAVLGWLLAVQQQFAEANEAFQRASKLDPDDAEYLTGLAQIHALEGKLDVAKTLLQRAVAVDQTGAMAHATLAKAYAAGGQERAALHEVQEAVHFMPEKIASLNVYLRLAETCELLRKTTEAIEHYSRIVTLSTELGMNPTMIRDMEKRITRLEALLTPTFIEAAMPQGYTEQGLDEILHDRLSETERQLVANPFSCTEPMRQWAQELTRDAATDLDKARGLFDGLARRLHTRGQARSRTAREVFEAWNDAGIRLVCMDHAVLFVALARAVDVNAFFVQVTQDPDGTIMNHACGAVFADDRVLLVDSSLRWFGAPHKEYAILSDLQTAAFLCFNNRDDDERLLSVCRAGLKLWPDSVQGRLCLAGALHHAGQSQEARRLCAEVGSPGSTDLDASGYWTLQGLFAEADEELERAEQHLRKAATLCATQASIHFHLGRVCLRRGRLADARTAFRACLRNDPDPANADVTRHLIAKINEKVAFESTSDMPSTDPNAP